MIIYQLIPLYDKQRQFKCLKKTNKGISMIVKTEI